MLRPETQRVWDHLSTNPLLGQFILVGGTALSMHLDHRISEDLDFMIGTPKLPRRKIDALNRECLAAGFVFRANDAPESINEFEDTGMEYLDYQQDYVVNEAVKLTFVAPDPEVSVLLNAGQPGKPRVASIEEIFRLKCIACANRSKTRDWLDMYLLLKQEYFQPIDIYKTFVMAGVPSKFDIAMSRMINGVVHVTDPGFECLLKDPPTVEQMQTYFADVLGQVQSEVARMKVHRAT